jgi:maltose O-acetyltransferase
MMAAPMPPEQNAPAEQPTAEPPPDRLYGFARARQVFLGEFENISLGLLLTNALVAPLPRLGFGRFRAGVYRAMGLPVGAGTLILGELELSGGPAWRDRLTIGARCVLNSPLFIDLNDRVVIEDEVSIGHHVTLITSSHLVGKSERRAGMMTTAPITLGAGCWLSAGVTVLPGVTVGKGSIVAAGSLVASDIPPHKMAGGVPARVVKSLPEIP